MRVLSLFDGISCGQLALQRAGISVDTYYASEVDFYAKLITQHAFPDTIQMGCVTGVKPLDVDLILGGSPCQGFSIAGKRLNLDDPRSALIEHYFDLVERIRPRYFLLENVPMARELVWYVTDRLGVQPLLLNSSLVSGQGRKRLYWTNIPVAPIRATYQYFNKWLFARGHGWRETEIKFWIKSPTVTCSFSSNYFFANKQKFPFDDWKLHTTTIPVDQCELLQTLPSGYTKLAPRTERYKMIGNCWTVDLIAAILKGIKNGE